MALQVHKGTVRGDGNGNRRAHVPAGDGEVAGAVAEGGGVEQPFLVKGAQARVHGPDDVAVVQVQFLALVLGGDGQPGGLAPGQGQALDLLAVPEDGQLLRLIHHLDLQLRRQVAVAGGDDDDAPLLGRDQGVAHDLTGGSGVLHLAAHGEVVGVNELAGQMDLVAREDR